MNLSQFFQRLFFSSITPTMRAGEHEFLMESDMPPLPNFLDPRGINLAQHPLDLSSPWRFGLKLIGNNRKRFTTAFLLMVLYTFLSLATPILVFRLVKIVRMATTTEVSLPIALGTALAMAAAPMLTQLTIQHYFYAMLNLRQTFVNILNQHIYSHSLKISQTDRSKLPVGDLVNHMGSDSDTMSDLNMVVCELSNSAITVLGGTILLLYFAGWSALVGLAVILCITPLTRLIAPKMVNFGNELMGHTDSRVTNIAQILRGIRIVKYFCWTRGVEAEVQSIREKELASRMRLAVAESIANLGFSSIPVLVALAVFGTRILAGKGLDAATAFSCIATFSIMQDPIGRFSHLLGNLLQMRVSAGRLIGFFSLPASAKVTPETSGHRNSTTIRIQNLLVEYEGRNEATLKNISLTILPGESVALVGPVASGKSTLLLAMLGEVPVRSGSVTLSGDVAGLTPRIAWVPQEAFIINATVKENILLGANENNLEEAVSDAMLSEDIRQLPAGLNTEIGDHGVNLSGGQKQRVSLARAAMQNADIVLLDDPLSAVDHNTENGLITRLLFGRWKSTTRVVATHRLTHLQRFDKIVFMVNGHIAASGSYQTVMAESAEFRAFVAERANIEDQGDIHHESRADSASAPVQPNSAMPDLSFESMRVTEDEDRATGAVKANVYWGYLKYFGGDSTTARTFILGIFALGLLATTALPMLQETWLAAWLNQAEYSRTNLLGLRLPPLASDSSIGIGVYALLGLFIIIAFLEHQLFSRWRSLHAGRRLHEEAFAAVLRAPIRFFDATPMGRILNRFSRDILVADDQLSWSMPDFIWCLTKVAVTMTFIIMIVPQASLVMVPVFYAYYRFQRLYRASAREAKRLDSITRSPRYSHFKETLEGLAVIRAFNRTAFFTDKFISKLERNQRMFHAMIFMNRWFSTRVPLLSGSITLAVTVGVVLLARSGQILPGTAGLALGFLLNFTGSLNWAVRAFSDLESQMTGIERLQHFSKIVAEPDLLQQPVALQANEEWPTRGTIEFHQVEARYAPHLPLVLKGVSALVPGGKRVALVGRTGSGKTTLFQALFRFVELTKGEIRIDGKNIAAIPLERLRQAIAVIPQDPVLFIGTLRRNLDYFSRHSDEAVWNALKRVHLADYVASLPGQLHAPVLENGANLSQGQRQLVCLARAFLDKSRIIVMDEATASVDVQTDALIQRTIREECNGITVLVIAHRLGTVSDCDLTLQLEEGRMVQN